MKKNLLILLVKCGLFIFFFGVIIVLFFLLQNMKIQKVVISCQFPLNRGYGIFQNAYISLLSDENIRTSFLSRNDFLQDIQIKRIYPNTIFLSCTPRIPIAIIDLLQNKKFIDEQGIVFSQDMPGDNLPIISLDSKKSIELTKDDWRMKKIARYISQLKNISVLMRHIYIEQDSSRFRFLTSEGTDIIILQKDDPNIIVTSLQTIISRFRIEGKIVLKIDMQFDKPVVVLKDT
jgi:hypothetical protein